jgi:hypothetical protein
MFEFWDFVQFMLNCILTLVFCIWCSFLIAGAIKAVIKLIQIIYDVRRRNGDR